MTAHFDILARRCRRYAEITDLLYLPWLAGVVIALAEADNARPDITYQARDLFDVAPDRDGRFDLVPAVNTLFAVRDCGRVLPHVRSLIARGGRLVVIDVVNPPARRPYVAPGAGVPGGGHDGRAAQVTRRGVGRPPPAPAPDLAGARDAEHPADARRLPRPLPAGLPGACLDDTPDRYLCGLVWNAPS
ncbi:hypothetical protein AB0H12_24040 [Actinosynnema sp. NPDC023794]